MRKYWIFGLLLLLSGGCEKPEQTFSEPDQKFYNVGDQEYAWDPLIPAAGDPVFVDRGSGSVFNIRGEAIEGPYATDKRMLTLLPQINMFWFAFTVYFPGAEVLNERNVRSAQLPLEKVGISGCGGGKDCIPSLPNAGPPNGALHWAEADEAGAGYLRDEDLVVGTFIKGAPRAYPHNILWWHEIANDQVGDQKYSVTFCPLTGSAVVFDGSGKEKSFGVSGNLFNSNLVMYDHQTETLWPQLWMGKASGSADHFLPRLPHKEMTWAAWRELHPETLVLHDDTGFSRDYQRYPYGDYRDDHDDTFRETEPSPDDLFPGKTLTITIVDRANNAAKGYPAQTLTEEIGALGLLNDEFQGDPIVIFWDAENQNASLFLSQIDDENLSLELDEYRP